MATLEIDREFGEVKSLCELIKRVDSVREHAPRGSVWLRGMASVEYELVPTAGREQWFAGRTVSIDATLEQRLLHQFRRHACGVLGRSLSEWEALVVARHHGLPVRLLDWTGDPMAALYFATEFERSGVDLPDSAVWLLVPSRRGLSNHIDIFQGTPGPFEVRGIRLVYPMTMASRINAQSGLFTIQEQPGRPLDRMACTYADNDVDAAKLLRLVVPKSRRAPILKELNDLQVTRRTLYPDLDGLAAGLVHAEVLRGPKSALAEAPSQRSADQSARRPFSVPGSTPISRGI